MKSLLLALLLLPAAVLADDLTDYGELVSVEIVASGSDRFSLLAGRLTLRINDVDTAYTWGGSTCNGRDLAELQETQLQNALLAPYMRVRLSTKPGQGGVICVVGYEVTNEKFLTS